MRCNERKVTLELLRETSNWLVSRFRMSKPTIRCYSFEEQFNPKHYVTIELKKSGEGFGALVNADFDFARPVVSDNYSESLDLGRKLSAALGAFLKW